jgi:hypothetical protein
MVPPLAVSTSLKLAEFSPQEAKRHGTIVGIAKTISYGIVYLGRPRKGQFGFNRVAGSISAKKRR